MTKTLTHPRTWVNDVTDWMHKYADPYHRKPPTWGLIHWDHLNDQLNPMPYRMSLGASGDFRLEKFADIDPHTTRNMADVKDIPDWAMRVWSLAAMGGYVMHSTAMLRKVVWFTRYGPPVNKVVVHDYSRTDQNDLTIPLENLYDNPELPD